MTVRGGGGGGCDCGGRVELRRAMPKYNLLETPRSAKERRTTSCVHIQMRMNDCGCYSSKRDFVIIFEHDNDGRMSER